MIRHPRRANRPQIDGVESLQRFNAVLGHHTAVLEIILAAPGKIRPFKPESSVQRGGGFQRLHALADHLRADAVARNDCDPVCLHFFLLLSFILL